VKGNVTVVQELLDRDAEVNAKLGWDQATVSGRVGGGEWSGEGMR